MEDEKTNRPGRWRRAKWVLVLIGSVVFTQTGQHGQITGWISGLFSG